MNVETEMNVETKPETKTIVVSRSSHGAKKSRFFERFANPDTVTAPTPTVPTHMPTMANSSLLMVADPAMELNEDGYRKYFTQEDVDGELSHLECMFRGEVELTLCVGSHVMSIVNIVDPDTHQLVVWNGSQGIVDSFCPLTNEPIVTFYNGHQHTMSYHTCESTSIRGVTLSYIPLVLSWAISIHKSQGCTLDMAEIDVGHHIFAHSQTYVALSRVRTLEGLFLTAFDITRIRVHPVAKQFVKRVSAAVAKDENVVPVATTTEPEPEIKREPDPEPESESEPKSEPEPEMKRKRKQKMKREPKQEIKREPEQA
jgi:hypothetical protein